ncbi:MAG: NAD-dependent epimerase/dehydratase family protein [Acidobacteria bacterium]|nr:NAD-dependent epimerase/dehydratase family protein [Acidobacteriota bacterium]MBI3656344.1 NAD-dependent epimerase/dehydratase family protein [Acidobacteriota bacterium]
MKILITGGTGFIGSHLVRRLLLENMTPQILALPGDRIPADFEQAGVKVYRGDIRDYPSLVPVLQGVDTVFHTAALVTDWAPLKLFHEVNIQGMDNMLRASVSAGVTRFVTISTNDVFGVVEDVLIDETFPLKKWGEPYADTKIEAEKLVWKYYVERRLPVTMVYPCWVYGPGDATFMPALLKAIRRGDMLFWRKAARLWPTYIDNLIDLLMVLRSHPAAVGNGYLVHDGESVALEKFCREVAKRQACPPPTRCIPYGLALAAARVMETLWKAARRPTRPLLTTYAVKNLGSCLRFSIQKAEKELGWQPKISFSEGFEITMAWLENNPSFKE